MSNDRDGITLHTDWSDPSRMFHYTLPPFPGNVFHEFVESANEQITKSRRTAEQEFADLDVQVGDRVRLTRARRSITNYSAPRWVVDKDAAVLEGNVLGIKERNGKSQLRIAGFDHTGESKQIPGTSRGATYEGGQHVWFPVENYRIEVLHKVYRMTDEDRLIAAVAGVSVKLWEQMSETLRETNRRTYKARVDKIREILQPEVDQ